MEYKGIIVKHGDIFLLFFEKSAGVFSDGIPITDSENVYGDLKDSNINFCKVKFCDGNEPKAFESFEKLEDIFFAIKDLAVIVMCDREQNEVNAVEALQNEGEALMTAFFAEPIFNE